MVLPGGLTRSGRYGAGAILDVVVVVSDKGDFNLCDGG